MKLYILMIFLIYFIFSLYVLGDKFFFLLILVEGIMVIMMSMFFLMNSSLGFSFELLFMFLSMMIMEGTMGMALIISTVFLLGNDKFSINSFF